MDVTELDRSVPLMTIEAFAAASGLTTDTVRAMVYRGHLFTMKIGKRRLINVEALRLDAISKYAELPR